MAIEVHYYLRGDQTSPRLLLGKEISDDIEEVLLPSNPSADNPIFWTKKFSSHAQHRWQVIGFEPPQPGSPASGINPATPTIFTITLAPTKQIDKSAWLPNIAKSSQKNPKSLLTPGCFVEIEYGHPMFVGKASGLIKTNKRYPESFQYGSMPKRRIGIVISTKFGKNNRISSVQVMPITSQPPTWEGDPSVVEVTDELRRLRLLDYPKESWAVANMLESIAPTRVFALVRQYPTREVRRDISFGARLSTAKFREINVALAHGTSQQGLLKEKTDLESEVSALKEQLAVAQAEIQRYQHQFDHRDSFINYLDDFFGRGSILEMLKEYTQPDPQHS